MKNSNIFIFSVLLLLVTVYSCVSKRKYLDQVKLNNELKLAHAQLLADHDHRAVTDIAHATSVDSAVNSQRKYFDTTVNNLISQANQRINLMSADYRTELNLQLLISRNELYLRLKKQFQKHIQAGLVSVNKSDEQVKLTLDIDKLYDRDKLAYTAIGKQIITELDSSDDSLQYRFTTEDLVTYVNSMGKKSEARANTVALTDLLELSNMARRGGIKNEDQTPINGEYLSEKICMTFSFKSPINIVYSLNSYANDGLLIKELFSISETPDSTIAPPPPISLNFGDNNNIKYLIYPSVYVSLNLGKVNNEELVKKIKMIESKKFSNMLRVEGMDRTYGICSTRKAVIILSKNNTLLKRYALKYIKCENPVFDLNL